MHFWKRNNVSIPTRTPKDAYLEAEVAVFKDLSEKLLSSLVSVHSVYYSKLKFKIVRFYRYSYRKIDIEKM